jgi:hypothetical protein
MDVWWLSAFYTCTVFFFFRCQSFINKGGTVQVISQDPARSEGQPARTMLPHMPLEENTCPNSQQPLRSAIRARLEHLSMDDMGPMPPTADKAFAESVAVLMSGPAGELPSSGWQTWPVASEAHRGLVYLPCEGCFAYHSDVEADDDCVVHFGAPRAGRAHVYPRAALLQPPFSTHHICTASAAAAEAEVAPKQSVEPLTPTTDSEAAWAAGFASKQAAVQS